MTRFGLRALRDAPWLTADRVRGHARMIALIAALAVAALALTATGGVDVLGNPLGTDFSAFHAAGSLARDGQATAAYDWGRLHAVEQALFGSTTPLYIWSYPPFALLPMSWLAGLPYGWALATFLVAGFGAYWVVVRRLAPPGTAAFWAIAGFPAVYVNVVHGQNGFLSTALLGAGLALLERRPALAGVLIGLMAYKPQLMLLVPIALVCGGCWRTIVSAGITVAGLCALSVLAYGTDPWYAFVEGLGMSRRAILDEGSTGFHKLQSVLAAVRLLGGSTQAAWAAQALVGLASCAVVIRVWRTDAPLRIRSAVLCAAALLSTPFLNVYDLVLLALPAAMITGSEPRYVARPWEGTTLLAAWLLPIFCVPLAERIALPTTPWVLAALLAVCAARARAPAARPAPL